MSDVEAQKVLLPFPFISFSKEDRSCFKERVKTNLRQIGTYQRTD